MLLKHLTSRTAQWIAPRLALGAMLASIPAFYLTLSGPTVEFRIFGHILYGLVGLAVFFNVSHSRRGGHLSQRQRLALRADTLIAMGAGISVIPSHLPWSSLEWFLRLGLCALIFVRLTTLAGQYVAPNRLFHLFVTACGMMSIAGAGFYWLEPSIGSYADGIWLAFTTVATVGYGDLVPTTPAARIFAVFIVLLGYALFSIVTASISALFIGEDEKRLRQELHADIRELRREVQGLRAEITQYRGSQTNSAVQAPAATSGSTVQDSPPV